MLSSNKVKVYAFRPRVGKGDVMAKGLKRKRDEAKQAWESAKVVMKSAAKEGDTIGSKKAHDEAEKHRVDYLKAETVAETDSDDESTRATAHR